jgi:LysR family hydrogen peroxide-inducible transcriptional activator
VFYDAREQQQALVQLQRLDLSNMCLLEEGHCMRNQVLELCDFHDIQLNSALNFKYKAGSIDSLLRFVRANRATTLLPHLSAIELSEAEQSCVSRFENPVPFRSIGLVVHRHFVKHKMLQHLKEAVLEKVKPLLPEKTTSSGKMLLPV